MLMETLSRWIGGVNDVLWTYVLVAALLGCAVWFTLRTRGVQFRLLGEMMRVLGESAGSGPEGERHVSSFQAFAVSLASRVGTGNLAGVATAIAVGGPGAVFWMWLIALLGGATYSTADTVRPALQLIKTKPENKIVSSCFIMVRPSATGENEVLAMADCAINIKPTEDELVEIGLETATTAKVFGIDPKVAYLSYSTLGSGKGEDVDKMRNACSKLKALAPDLDVDGELQFDAAVSPRVARTKCPDSKVAGHANTFIFPDINAGNIGYKIAQRLGGFDAYGPILLGLNAPINDLSRGCFADDIVGVVAITAVQAQAE